MCGIFGFVASKPQKALLVLEGLKILEYRGYDSWGIAVKQEKKLVIEKHIGKIGSAKTTLPDSFMGIGHTRWATHGGVTVANSHPHLDCKKELAVVHNGIVENFEELKKELIKQGHKFVSETDTEIIPHLIENYMKQGLGFSTSVRKAFSKLTGLNAIVVSFAPSTQIVAVKSGSPLIVGVSKNEFYLASDISSFIGKTRKVLFLKDNEMVIVGDSIELISGKDGKKLEVKPETVDWKFELANMGKFSHFMIKEIYEQPQIIKNIPKYSKSDVQKLSKYIQNAKGTFLLGCGTASYAAFGGEYLFSKIAKIHVNFSTGSEFKYIQDFINKKSLIIPISQSGETIDVVEPVQKAKEKGAIITPIVNVESSTLARLGDFFLPLNSGQEKAVVGTKSFTAMVGLLLLTSYDLVHKFAYGKKLLELSSKDVSNILKPTSINNIKRLSKKIAKKEHVFTIGRGLSYVAAIEAALKLKETALIHAEGFAGGELKHGVIALIEKDTPCIVFAPNDETYDDIISNAQEIKARGGYIIGIGPKKAEVFDEFIKTGDTKEATLISQIVVMQLLAYYLALDRGIEDPDKPRNLAKSVTVK